MLNFKTSGMSIPNCCLALGAGWENKSQHLVTRSSPTAAHRSISVSLGDSFETNPKGHLHAKLTKVQTREHWVPAAIPSGLLWPTAHPCSRAASETRSVLAHIHVHSNNKRAEQAACISTSIWPPPLWSWPSCLTFSCQ